MCLYDSLSSLDYCVHTYKNLNFLFPQIFNSIFQCKEILLYYKCRAHFKKKKEEQKV